MGVALKMEHITKRYPGVVANDDVSISLKQGTVLCIIGENGAGKSTLMNVLYGMERPDGGDIYLDGQKVEFHSSRDAMKQKIGMVFQHFMLVKELTCLENIIMGMEPKNRGVIDYKAARAQLNELMEQYHMQVPLDKPVGKLWVGMQQKVEILKTLYRGAQIIILDEPTAVLTPQETEELFSNIRKLTAMGKSVILITHKLDEVMRVADHITVMRAGKVVKEVEASETDVDALSLYMVGHELPPMKEREKIQPKNALELKDVCTYQDNGLFSLEHVNLSVCKGEILGVAGISGNGQRELARVVSGLMIPDFGSVFLNGVDITSHDRKRKLKDGISYIPEDRNSTGVCGTWSIENNCFAGYQDEPRFVKKGGFINRQAAKETARQMIEKFAVKTPDETVSIKSMSGGNCQKIVVARETWFDPEVIIAAEPSRGVDIGAINTIHNHMIGLRNKGTAILLISSSLDEIFALSDRIAVIYEGKIVAVVDSAGTTREELGLYMSGAKGGKRDESC